MHDLAIKYGYNKEIDKTKLANMVKYILQTDDEESNTTVEWLNNIEILDDKAIHEKYDQNIKEQDQLKKDQADLENAIEKNNYYKSLMYYSGDKLVEVVEEILEEMLSIKVDDKDYKKQDLYLKLDDKNILIEVKGVNHPFQRDNISQVKRHIKDYAEENQIYGSDVDKLCKGVLILNPYSLHNLKEKLSKDFYSKEVIEDAKYENVCTIDTLTLLNYYSKWKTNSSSVDLKKILLNSNYIKPDYDEIINL